VGSPVFERLRALLARRRVHAGPAPGAVPVRTPELIAALLRQQDQVPTGGAGAWRLEKRLRLQEKPGPGPAAQRALEQADEDTLDLVLLLFERILQHRALPGAVKAEIARLQIPIAVVALVDKDFFERSDHPARRCLDHLARSGRGWVDDGARPADGALGQIRRAVEQVLADHGRDPAVFARVDAELSARLAHEEERARGNEARLCRELDERERRLSAHALVQGLVEERLGACQELPEAVRSLVAEGWEQVMLAAYLEGGETGERWRSAVATLERLLWSVQPKVADEDRRELLRGIPELLRRLRESLADVAYDPRRLAARFRELQALHLAALRRAKGPPSATSVPAAGADAVSAASAARGRTADRSPAVGLRIGTWLEMRLSEGPVRVKLAWYGAESGIHLFVDRRGEKVLELQRADLETYLEHGLALVLGDDAKRLLDWAIDDLAQALERG
jgi:hypothetical protein